MTNRAEQLAELAAECATCTRCGLHAGRTRSVFSDGNPAAKIMLIGEGPGYLLRNAARDKGSPK